jgi:spore coat protein U-like protein
MTALRVRGLRHAAQLALALMCITTAFETGAAYNCTISATAITTVYSPSVPTPNDSTGSYTINCTRLATDANTLTYRLEVNDGANPTGGGQRRVRYNPPGPGNYTYIYNLYRDAGFTQLWGDTGTTDIDGTLNFGASLSASFTGPFYMRVPQDLTPGAAGTYTDSVQLTMFIPGPNPTATIGISVITTNSCQISVAPGNVNFTYTSFQPGPAAASTTYGVRCTTALPYTMTLDGTLPYTYTLLGLTYTLSLPAGATGNGLTQTHTVDGTIAAGQSGTCATAVCNGSQTRTLTITY